MEEEGVIANAALIGSDVLGPGLADLAARHELVGEVRGTGVFWAIELVADRTTREPVPAATMAALKRDLLARGLLPFVVDNRIHVVPPAVITPAEARHGLRLIDDALSAFGDQGDMSEVAPPSTVIIGGCRRTATVSRSATPFPIGSRGLARTL